MVPEIHDNYLIVRGGQGDLPPPGTVFSASVGRTLEESAAGVPHGMIRVATASQIRANAGKLVALPEIDLKSGTINQQHVHVVEGDGESAFGLPQPNPVPKRKRLGGPDYHDPELP